MAEQTFKNHSKFVPLYHYVTLPLLALNLVQATVVLVRVPHVTHAIAVLTALALILTALFARVFALRVQDRVIRLEMRLRLAQILPADQRKQIDALSKDQMIGLRFASDAEMPDLVKTVLDRNIQNKTEIKRLVKNWVGDYDRA